MITKLMFRLLPAQILLNAVNAVNGIVSSFFASNYVGVDAMSAVGLYSPVNMLINAVSITLIAGSAIMCGRYMGQNNQEKLQSTFSLNLLLSTIIAALFTLLFLVAGDLDLTGIITNDEAVRPLFNRYLMGQAIGILPFILGSQLPAYLIMENRNRRSFAASIVYFVVNLMLNFVFVQLLHLEEFGLALASSLGMWAFFLVEAQYFVSGRSHLRFSAKHINWSESREMLIIGFPGAACNAYQTLRGMIVNWLLTIYVGSVGVSAFATANYLLALFWAIPCGMQAVSRVLFSVSAGEEDRQTLTDIMRVMFFRFIPLQCAISFLIMICAVPLTHIFYNDPSEPVFMMTVWGFRILPLCMPLAIISMHYTSYGQTFGKQLLVHVTAVLDGVVCVAGFSALLTSTMGVSGVYVANVLNGIVVALVFFGYAWIKNKHFPRNMEELMVIPDGFGADQDERIDLSVRDMGEVVEVAKQIQAFCISKSIDSRRAYLAGLAMEEMAGNVVEHGFSKDSKSHTVDVRVTHKGDDVILRIKDDCIPFSPAEQQKLAEKEDITSNIGIRMVFRTASDIQYQNILGLNVLTIRI